MNNGVFNLDDFVRESNRIEGILREPTGEEVMAHIRLLAKRSLAVEHLCDFVEVVAPGHVLRERTGLNVRVGSHVAPAGGPAIRAELAFLLDNMEPGQPSRTTYEDHLAYETLHPFTDGNGRSGRALWLWQVGGIDRAPLGFLHHWYYQTLENAPNRNPAP